MPWPASWTRTASKLCPGSWRIRFGAVGDTWNVAPWKSLDSLPVRPSIAVGAPVCASVPVMPENPSMWSNERFSSISTNTWRTPVSPERAPKSCRVSTDSAKRPLPSLNAVHTP